MKLTASYDISGLTEREKAFHKNAAKQLRRHTEMLQGLLGDRIREQIGTSPGGGGKLGSRSGRLRDAFLPGKPGNIDESTTTDTASEAVLGVEYDVLPYWRIQNVGGVIKPKNVKYLTVPLTEAARRTTARKVEGLFVLRANGKLFLVKSKDEGIEFWYILKLFVKVQPTHYLDDAEINFKRSVLPAAGEDLLIDLARAWDAS